MSLENIAEICIAIDTAILGIAYPIIIDKISNIGDKYSSDYLSNVFNTEFPQNEINLGSKKVSTFQFMLYLNILILVFLVFRMEPLFGWDNWIINNSADILVLLSTSCLTTIFFIWLNKVLLLVRKYAPFRCFISLFKAVLPTMLYYILYRTSIFACCFRQKEV